jgi:excisionase family DNA binding protein
MPAEPTTRPAAFSINSFARELSISRGTVYNMHKAGGLKILKIGGRSIVPAEELDRILSEAPELGE